MFTRSNVFFWYIKKRLIEIQICYGYKNTQFNIASFGCFGTLLYFGIQQTFLRYKRLLLFHTNPQNLSYCFGQFIGKVGVLNVSTEMSEQWWIGEENFTDKTITVVASKLFDFSFIYIKTY